MNFPARVLSAVLLGLQENKKSPPGKKLFTGYFMPASAVSLPGAGRPALATRFTEEEGEAARATCRPAISSTSRALPGRLGWTGLAGAAAGPGWRGATWEGTAGCCAGLLLVCPAIRTSTQPSEGAQAPSPKMGTLALVQCSPAPPQDRVPWPGLGAWHSHHMSAGPAACQAPVRVFEFLL